MKFVLIALVISVTAFAAPIKPGLFVKEGPRLLNVESLIKNGSDIQAEYGFENFCYKGQSEFTINQIKRLNKAGSFFSGGGGGHELKSVTLLRGFVTYDIALRFEDEVVPGEFTTVNVKPCK